MSKITVTINGVVVEGEAADVAAMLAAISGVTPSAPVATPAVAAPSVPAAAPAAATPARPDFILPAGTKLLICKAADHDAECWDTNIIPTTNMGNVAVPHSLVVEGALRPAFKRQGLLSGACYTANKTSICPDRSNAAIAEQAKTDAALAAKAAAIPNILPNASVDVTAAVVPGGVTHAQLAAMFSATDLVEVEDTDGL